MLCDSGVCGPELLLISCVTVTTGRHDLIQGAVQSFLAQTYPRREMVILSQGSPDANKRIEEYVKAYPNIQLVEAPSRLTLGEMRNASVELAHGDVICQWDDDDYYHPSRLAAQFKALRANAVASLYTAHLKYFADTGQLYMIDYLRGTEDYMKLCESHPYKRFLCGSVMFRKSCFYHAKNRLYPERGAQSGREEDLNVLQRLMQMGHITPVHTPFHYCYVFHGGNVYERHHHEMLFHKKHIATMDELMEQVNGIDDTLRASGVRRAVDICTSPPLNFDIPDTSLVGETILTYTPSS